MKTNKIFIILLISLLAIIMGTTTAGATSVYDGFSDLNAWSQEHWVPGVGYQATTTGTVSGGVLTVADNNDEYHLIHTTAQYAKPFTVSYDIWPVSGTQMILRFTGTLSFVEYTMIVNGNQQTFNGVTVAGNIPAGEWTHVKINVYANNTVEVYNNGVKKITSTYGSIGTPTAFSFREQLAHFKLKNFYMSDVVESDYVPEVDVTFNGYVKNANGDPLQYANVTLWDYSVPLNSDLTDANGYYEFVETITTGHAGYIQSVWPANEGGYTNAEVYGANTSINPFTKNFTAAPVKLQVYVYDGNYGVNTEIDAFDIVVNKNNGAEILSYSGKDSGWIFPGTLNVSDNIVLTVSKTGYMNGTDTINPIEAGWNFGQVPLYQEFSGGNFVRISGYTRDQEGVKIPGLEMWLEDAATNAIIYHTVSGSFDGYYSICVPTAYNPKTYKVVINYPGHGNLTTSLKKASTMLNFGTGSTFTYPTDFTGVDPTNEGVDLLLALAYVPTPTATPSGNPPPVGYYEISGRVTDSNGALVSGIPIYLLYANGTVSTVATTNAGGSYAMFFPDTMAFDIYTLKCGEKAGYDNATMQNFYSLVLPELFQYTSDNNLKFNFVIPVDDYAPNYVITGRVYDTGTNAGLISAYVTLYDGTNADIAYALTNGAGAYTLTLPDNLAFGQYRVGYSHAGYYEQNLTVVFPEDFGGASTITHDAPMAPIPGGSLSNIIGHVYATNTGAVIQNALVVAKYHANGTIVKSAYSDAYGAARIYSIGNGEYDIVVTATGFNSMSWYLNISTQNTYEAQIGMTPVVAPTAYPTVAPTATPTPTAPINALNPIEAFISLLMLVGMDRATSQIILGFVLVLLGGFVMAIISQKIAMEANAGYLIAGGAAAGFVAACMIPTSTGTLWPQWLLLIAGILTVVIAVGFFLKQSNTGG